MLENKYNPYKIVNKLSAFKLRGIIKIVFGQEINKVNNDVDWKKQMIVSYKIFYDTKIVNSSNKIKRNLKDEKILLNYTLITLNYTSPEILYGLFKLLIIISKK